MEIKFDSNSKVNEKVKKAIEEFLSATGTLEQRMGMPAVVFQDGVSGAYYIKCSILAGEANQLCDLSAKLEWKSSESFRANRELHKNHHTYEKMAEDAGKGREFNDIIVEYNKAYLPNRPLKVWGGQHRISAIRENASTLNRYHGFKIYFELNKKQRTEVALISNTNINVSNDTFDRMLEETIFGDKLRQWCVKVGLLEKGANFPDVGSKSENITVKMARSFIVNYFLGLARGKNLPTSELDKNFYEPQIIQTGVELDPEYSKIMKKVNILKDSSLNETGKNFARLHFAQYDAVSKGKGKIKNLKSFRNKAYVASVLCGWAYIAGLLQSHPKRLENHYRLPTTSNKIPDPLNAREMSDYKHESDDKTYRGLGTRSIEKDRQRLAQLFLAKSVDKDVTIDKNLMDEAVSQVVGLKALAKGYAK